MKLRQLLTYAETENTLVFQTDKKGHQTAIDDTKWKEYLSNEVESVCPRFIDNKPTLCVLLRCESRKFVKNIFG